jgi:hypothetical protein
MTVLETYQNVIEIDKGRLVDECLSELRTLVIDLNLFQLEQGLNATGKKLGRYKSNSYAKRKNQMNSLPGFGIPDLKLTGAFWNAFKTDLKSGVMDIYSTDPKAAWQEDRYAKIYGLTPENLNILRADFLIIFNDRLRAEIGLQ